MSVVSKDLFLQKFYAVLVFLLIFSFYFGVNYRVPLVLLSLWGIYYVVISKNVIKSLSLGDIFWLSSLVLWVFYFIVHGVYFEEDISLIGRETMPIFVSLIYFSLISNRKISSNFIFYSIAICLLIGSFKVFYDSFYLKESRPSFTYQPIIDANIQLLASLFCLFYIKSVKNNYGRLLLSLSFTVGIASAILSETRGIYPALIIFLVGFLYLSVKNEKRIVKIISAVLLGSVLVYAYYMVGDRVIEGTKNELHEIKNGNLNTSIGLRLQMWDVGIETSKQNWIFGNGTDNEIRKAITKEIIEIKDYHHNLMYEHHNFHNDLIDTFFKYGLVGVLVGILLLISSFFGVDRKWLVYVYIAIVVSVMAGLTVNYLEHRRAFLILLVMLCFVRYLNNLEVSEGEKNRWKY